MDLSIKFTGSLLAVLLLAVALGCQQQTSSTEVDHHTEAAVPPSSAPATPSAKNSDEVHPVQRVAAEQPIQAKVTADVQTTDSTRAAKATAVEPDFLSAPLESEVETNSDAPVLIISVKPDSTGTSPTRDNGE